MKIFLVFAGALVLLIGLGLIYYQEDVVSTYPTYAHAVDDGAAQRGWIPRYVPPSARDIREVHNLDSNRQWIRFAVPKSDAAEMASGLERVSLSEIRHTAPEPPRWRGAWPPELKEPLLITPRASLKFYRAPASEEGARCIAVENGDPAVVFAWTC